MTDDEKYRIKIGSLYIEAAQVAILGIVKFKLTPAKVMLDFRRTAASIMNKTNCTKASVLRVLKDIGDVTDENVVIEYLAWVSRQMAAELLPPDAPAETTPDTAAPVQ